MVKKARSPIPNGTVQFVQPYRPRLSKGAYEIQLPIKAKKPTIAEHGNEPFPTEQKLVEKEDT
tara:strand:+ start:77 stop:265 length:189 start_codon:yes stop_codon:yes gene_type:complete